MYLAHEPRAGRKPHKLLSHNALIAYRHTQVIQALLQTGVLAASLNFSPLHTANPHDDEPETTTTGILNQSRLVWSLFNDWLRCMSWVFPEIDRGDAIPVGPDVFYDNDDEDNDAGQLVLRPRKCRRGPLDNILDILEDNMHELHRETERALRNLALLAQGYADGRDEGFMLDNQQFLQPHLKSAFDAVVWLWVVEEELMAVGKQSEIEAGFEPQVECENRTGEHLQNTNANADDEDESEDGGVFILQKPTGELRVRACLRARLRASLNKTMALPLLKSTVTTQRDNNRISLAFPALISTEDTDYLVNMMEAFGEWMRQQWETFLSGISYGRTDVGVEDPVVRRIGMEETLSVMALEVLFQRAIALAISDARSFILAHGHLQLGLILNSRGRGRAATRQFVRRKIFDNPATRKVYVEKYLDIRRASSRGAMMARVQKKRKFNDDEALELEAARRQVQFNVILEGVSEVKAEEMRRQLRAALKEEERRNRTFMGFVRRGFLKIFLF
ncbi:hypothetical protein BDW74DRAFT_178076 [Aspergillus multicolor]|uniref:uncharacterized protein n=1 Tax=Aspergillus multicolor TaxID=41759 RepID=UPI003CCCCFC4